MRSCLLSLIIRMHEVPSHNSVWFLIARSLAHETSAEEEQILYEILKQEPSLQQQYDLLSRMWHAGNHFEVKNDEQEKRSVSRILQLATWKDTTGDDEEKAQRLSVKPNAISKNFLIAISSAAAIIITIIMGWM